MRRGQASAEELLDEAIARTDRLDPLLNAVVVKHYDFARRQIARGLPDGPFRGVPFLLKDLNLLAGTRTTFGASLNKDFVCLLYTSDAADERSSVDLGGRRIIKQKKTSKINRKS